MTQAARILEFLRSHPGGLTQLEAIDLGMGTRLAARISDIKDKGMLRPTEHIAVQMEAHRGGQHARYVLVDPTRTILTMDEWYAFQASPHRRNKHQPSVAPVTGCEWCVRMAAMEAVFRGGQVTVEENSVEPTLWDVA